MDAMETGLRYRIKRASRQIAEQHEHIRQMRASLVHAVEANNRVEVKDALSRYRGAIEAHFRLEDGVFFPAIHGLHPEHSSELESLSGQHTEFLASLATLGRLVEEGLDEFARELDAFEKQLRLHESREEHLVGRLGGD